MQKIGVKIVLIIITILSFSFTLKADNLTHPWIFQADEYLKLNPDLNASSLAVFSGSTLQEKATSHWLLFGINEGRASSGTFHVNEYREMHPDLKASGMNNKQLADHYITHGLNEGRWGVSDHSTHPFVFNKDEYLRVNPDLTTQILATIPGVNFDIKVMNHWRLTGINEGRVASTTFILSEYKAINPSLAGKSNRELIEAFVAKGTSAGGRVLTHPLIFDPVFYGQRYPELGLTGDALTTHFINDGFKNGRWGCQWFNVLGYRQRYFSVRAKIGEDLVAAAAHYITEGSPAGLTGYDSAPVILGKNARYVDGIVFNVDDYLKYNPDLTPAILNNAFPNIGRCATDRAVWHWVNYGVSENRRSSRSFSSVEYRQTNGDLSSMTSQEAVDHFVTHGINESRNTIIQGAKKAYFVDALKGSDSNDGLSPIRAWKDLSRISTQPLAPGDSVFLRRGCVWSNQVLNLTQSGTTIAPLTISAYGEGNLPLITNPKPQEDPTLAYSATTIDSRTNVTYGILVRSANDWVIRDLEIAHAQYGVITDTRTIGWSRSFTMEHCYIHDIDGGREWNVADVANMPFLTFSAAIHAFGNEILTIKDCFTKTACIGINVVAAHEFTLDGNQVVDSRAHGIDIQGANNGTISNTRIYNVGQRGGIWNGTTGIMFANSSDITMVDCEVGEVFCPRVDGIGIDYECNTRNITVQRTWIHDCWSAAFLIFSRPEIAEDMPNNYGSKILDCRIERCGEEDPATTPVFMHHYNNKNNKPNGAVISGNTIIMGAPAQKLNTLYPSDGYVGTYTNAWPADFTVMGNTIQ